MTPEDAQIDILLRRYARRAERDLGTQHLDADELNAFAEGAVPAEARSRYTSHLADCSHCRQLVSQLAMASGAAISGGGHSSRHSSMVCDAKITRLQPWSLAARYTL